MKKAMMLSTASADCTFTGCSSGPDYKVTVTKDLYFVKDTAMPFEIKVTENNKAVKGLDVSAQLSMTNMDHGSYDVKLVGRAKMGPIPAK